MGLTLRERSRMAQVCPEVVEAGLWQPGAPLSTFNLIVSA